ncbi:hypothetical protein, partial [Pontibacillus yanchengensis]|uniref:hypothetical protein n=1 Tax=Pontibacillus yanchengensis TaxID=462910 RepID=UPI001F3EB60A
MGWAFLCAVIGVARLVGGRCGARGWCEGGGALNRRFARKFQILIANFRFCSEMEKVDRNF